MTASGYQTKTRKYGQGNSLRRKLGLAIQVLLGDRVNATKAADEYGCSRRTIFRELKMLRDELASARAAPEQSVGVYSQEALRFAGLAEPQEHHLAGALALATAPAKAVGIDELSRRKAYEWHAARLDETHAARLVRKLEALSPLISAAMRAPTGPERMLDRLLAAAEQEDGAVAIVQYEINSRVRCARLHDLRIGQLADEDWWLLAKSEATGEPVRIQAATIRDVRIRSGASLVTSPNGEPNVDTPHPLPPPHHSRPIKEGCRREATSES